MKYEMMSIIVTLALMFVLTGCERKPVNEQAGQLAGGLAAEADQTYRNYRHALKSGTEKASDLIPSQYWAEGIKALNPLRVYIHRFNIVVVQRESDATEEGRYVYIPISSYMPVNGDDGFTFTRVEEDVYNFTRTKGDERRASVVELRLSMCDQQQYAQVNFCLPTSQASTRKSSFLGYPLAACLVFR